MARPAGLLGVIAVIGCGSVETTPNHVSDPPQVEVLRLSRGVDKLDLLVAIDNSRSMADKQRLLAAAIPELVRGLANPPCVGPGGAAGSVQPKGPLDPCPDGTKRRFPPISDIHVGVVTSSIGGHGADACPKIDKDACPGGATNTSNDDAAHLVTRLDPCSGGSVETYQGKGFLAWDPTAKSSPPGEASLGAINVDPATGAVSTATPGLIADLKDLVIGAGQLGCGYESSMESWYRFLIDPEPYESIAAENGKATPMGVDQLLLAQRRDFLRQGSLVAIVGLSDENDCSIKEYGQFYFAAQTKDPANPAKNFNLPPARSECAVDPNDPCCKSCGQDPGSCPPDPTCAVANTPKTDDPNLRCWDQKRRFGIDFLYSIQRYVDGLTLPVVPNRAGEMVPNPLFTDPDPNDADNDVRDPSMVFLTYLAGVPWQDIARQDDKGAPNLLYGLDHDGKQTGGFKDATELTFLDGSGHSIWDYVVGKPELYVAPLDPLMVESIGPRIGMNPFTGEPLAPPSWDPGPGPNSINGREHTSNTENGVQKWPDDLQYACIFDLPVPRDCSSAGPGACECRDPLNDNPLCEADPMTGERTLQVRAQAYPSIRQLALLRALGPQGIATSICPVQTTHPEAPDYGYRPAMSTLVKRITERLELDLGGLCVPRSLTTGPSGRAQCTILEGRNTGKGLDAGACAAFCASQPGRAALPTKLSALSQAVKIHPVADQIGVDCVCEIPQAAGSASPGCTNVVSELAACQCDPSDLPLLDGKTVDGWCYVDATREPALGSPEIPKNCPQEEQRLLRFAGGGAPVPGAAAFIACE